MDRLHHQNDILSQITEDQNDDVSSDSPKMPLTELLLPSLSSKTDGAENLLSKMQSSASPQWMSTGSKSASLILSKSARDKASTRSTQSTTNEREENSMISLADSITEVPFDWPTPKKQSAEEDNPQSQPDDFFTRRLKTWQAITGAATSESTSHDKLKPGTLHVATAKEKSKFKLPHSVFERFIECNPYRAKSHAKRTAHTTEPNIPASTKKQVEDNFSADLSTPEKVVPEFHDKPRVAFSDVKATRSSIGKSSQVLSKTNSSGRSLQKFRLNMDQAPNSKHRYSTVEVGRSSLGCAVASSTIARGKTTMEQYYEERTAETVRKSVENIRKQMKSRHKQRKSSASLRKEKSENSLTDTSESTREHTKMIPIDIFIQKAWLAWMFCKVCFGLRKYAFEGGVDPKNFEAHIPNTLLPLRHNAALQTFNPANYKARGEATWHRSSWQSILTPKELRTSVDIDRIRAIMGSIREFNAYPNDVQQKLCRYIRYERFGKNRVVVRRGDLGYQYYYIYSGKVHITYARKGKQLFSLGASMKKLGRGDSFGEQALSDSRRRTATVICSENSEFLTIDAEDFEESGLAKLIAKRLEERFTLLRSCQLFASWSDTQIEELSETGTNEFLGYGRMVVPDARHNDFIYLAADGTCDVLRAVDLSLSPLYMRCLRPHSMARMQEIHEALNNKPGITLMDDQILDCMEWWPDYLYENKLYDIKSKYERSLEMSRDNSLVTFMDDTGHTVRGSTINVLRQLVMNHGAEDSEANLLMPETSYSSLKDCTLNPRKTINIEGLGTSITFRRALNFDRKYTEQLPNGTFMKVGELTRGLWFGFVDLWGIERHCTLVSRGCNVVRLPKSKLLEMMDLETLKDLKKCLVYEKMPTDVELSRQAGAQLLWESTRQEVGRQVFDHIINRQQTGNFTKLCESRPSTAPDRDYQTQSYYVKKVGFRPPHKRNINITQAQKNTKEKTDRILPKTGKEKLPAVRIQSSSTRLAHLPEVVQELIRKKKVTAQRKEETILRKQLHSEQKTALVQSQHMKCPNNKWIEAVTDTESENDHDPHPAVIKQAKEKQEYQDKVDRLFLKARLRTLQRLVHGEQEQGIDMELEQKVADLFSPLVKTRKSGVVTNAITSEDPVLHAKPTIPRARPRQPCVPLRTRFTAFTARNKRVNLIEGLKSPLTRPAVRLMTRSID